MASTKLSKLKYLHHLVVPSHWTTPLRETEKEAIKRLGLQRNVFYMGIFGCDPTTGKVVLKCGQTQNLQTRLIQLQREFGYKMHLIFACETDRPKECELFYRRSFARMAYKVVKSDMSTVSKETYAASSAHLFGTMIPYVEKHCAAYRFGHAAQEVLRTADPAMLDTCRPQIKISAMTHGINYWWRVSEAKQRTTDISRGRPQGVEGKCIDPGFLSTKDAVHDEYTASVPKKRRRLVKRNSTTTTTTEEDTSYDSDLEKEFLESPDCEAAPISIPTTIDLSMDTDTDSVVDITASTDDEEDYEDSDREEDFTDNESAANDGDCCFVEEDIASTKDIGMMFGKKITVYSRLRNGKNF